MRLVPKISDLFRKNNLGGSTAANLLSTKYFYMIHISFERALKAESNEL